MQIDDLKGRISAIIAKYPTLNSFGFGAFDEHKLSLDERNAKIAKGQGELLNQVEEVNFVIEWLHDVEKTKSITQSNSYNLKHRAENVSPNGSITNGAFITGAIIAGFNVGKIDGPNCCFNMSIKSLKQVIQRGYMKYLWNIYGDKAKCIKKYAEADASGTVPRKSNINDMTSEQYAKALYSDGERRGWLR